LALFHFLDSATYQVSFQTFSALDVLEAVFTDIHHGGRGQLLPIAMLHFFSKTNYRNWGNWLLIFRFVKKRCFREKGFNDL